MVPSPMAGWSYRWLVLPWLGRVVATLLGVRSLRATWRAVGCGRRHRGISPARRIAVAAENGQTWVANERRVRSGSLAENEHRTATTDDRARMDAARAQSRRSRDRAGCRGGAVLAGAGALGRVAHRGARSLTSASREAPRALPPGPDRSSRRDAVPGTSSPRRRAGSRRPRPRARTEARFHP